MSKLYNNNENSNNKKITSQFYTMPLELLGDTTLTSSDKLVLMVIFSGTLKKGFCWASNESLGETTGLYKTSVSKIIKKLIDLKLIRTEMDIKENSKLVDRRRIYLLPDCQKLIPNPYKQNDNVKSSACQNDNLTLSNEQPHVVDTATSRCQNGKGNRSINRSSNKLINIDTNNNENNVILSDEDKEIDSFFKIPDETVKTDNRYMNAGLRPLNKFPDIWLTIESFKYVLDCIEKAKVDKGGVFNRVKQKIDNWKAQGRSVDCVDCASWLTGWALDAQIEHEAKNLKLNFYRENQK